MEQSHPDNFRKPAQPSSPSATAEAKIVPKETPSAPLSTAQPSQTNEVPPSIELPPPKPRRRSIVTSPLSLRASNSLPTPTPETVTLVEEHHEDEWHDKVISPGVEKQRRESLKDRIINHSEGRAASGLSPLATPVQEVDEPFGT